MSLSAIFDIGKTNKKLFLFDEEFELVYQNQVQLPETEDEAGFPCEDLPQLSQWMREMLREAYAQGNIARVNFSAYGASLVHLDQAGKAILPFYNYLKPFPPELLAQFFTQYGPESDWSLRTASPVLGLLNSGLQLYWLKHTQPAYFQQISQSLHLPQFCSYLFSGKAVSDYTSVGCHTGLWDFQAQDYHAWVDAEELRHYFAPIVPATHSYHSQFEGNPLQVGVGIHDSSSALLPYLLTQQEPFLLLSTGTWGICLNPFSTEALSADIFAQDCLNYLQIDGKPVRSSRVFLGREYQVQVEKLARHFGKNHAYHTQISFDLQLYEKLKDLTPVFQWEFLTQSASSINTPLEQFESYEAAYHKLLIELTDIQINAILLALGKSEIRQLFLDGGFVKNEVFVQLLLRKLPTFRLFLTHAPLGSALGAALVIAGKAVSSEAIYAHVSIKQASIL